MTPALLAGLSIQVVAAYVARNAVPVAEVPRVLESVHAQLSALAAGPTAPPAPGPALAPRASGSRRR